MAYATFCKLVQAVKETPETDLPGKESDAVDESTEEGKKKAAVVQRNAYAMMSLMYAFTSEVTIGLLYRASTSDWPSRLAYLVAVALFKKYRPRDTISHVEMHQQMGAIQMKKKEDPATIFNRLCSIESCYNTETRKIEEEDQIAVVLSAAPVEYKGVLLSEQQAKGSNLKLEDLESVMNQHF